MAGWLDGRMVGCQDIRIAEWQDSKFYPRCSGGPQLLHCSHRFSSSSGGSSGWFWRSVPPGFYSPTQISTAHSLWVLPRAPWVRAGRLCVIRFLPHCPLPWHSQGRPTVPLRKEATNLLPSAFVGNILWAFKGLFCARGWWKQKSMLWVAYLCLVACSHQKVSCYLHE